MLSKRVTLKGEKCQNERKTTHYLQTEREVMEQRDQQQHHQNGGERSSQPCEGGRVANVSVPHNRSRKP
jgi:hypothetical protein